MSFLWAPVVLSQQETSVFYENRSKTVKHGFTYSRMASKRVKHGKWPVNAGK